MAFFERRDDSVSSTPVARRPLVRPEQRIARDNHLADGTLACPECDAPVALGGHAVSPADWMACPYCAHVGAVRSFLSLRTPGRPARVTVRVKA